MRNEEFIWRDKEVINNRVNGNLFIGEWNDVILAIMLRVTRDILKLAIEEILSSPLFDYVLKQSLSCPGLRVEIGFVHYCTTL